MKLRFYAKRDLLVTMPGQSFIRRNADTGAGGQAVKYVGRTHVPAVIEQAGGVERIVKAASNPATPDPFECDSDTPRGQRLIKMVRRDQCLWPADKETADACSVPFVETVFKDGEHVEKDPKPLLNKHGRVKNCSPVGTPGEQLGANKATPGTPNDKPEADKARGKKS